MLIDFVPVPGGPPRSQAVAGRLLVVAAVLSAGPAWRTRPAVAQPADARASALDALLHSLPEGTRPRPATLLSPAADALGDPLPPGARLRLGTQRFHAPSYVTDLALSPDGTTLVSVGAALTAWDVATGKELWRAAGHDLGPPLPSAGYGVRALAFSADGTRFYTPGRTQGLVAWEAASGRRAFMRVPSSRALDNPNSEAACSIDVTPDGRAFAVGDGHGLVVYDPEGNILHELPNAVVPPPRVDRTDRLTSSGRYCLGRFSPDGKTLAVATSDRPAEVLLCDAATGRAPRRLALGAPLVRMSFSPDGRRLAATERDSAVRVYDVATGKRAWSHVVRLNHPNHNYTSAVSFSPDGSLLAACASDRGIDFLDPSTGEEFGRLKGHHSIPWALAFAADGKTLYSADSEGVIRRWDVEARTQLALPAGIRASAVVTASPDGRWLAYADDVGTIRIVGAEDGQERRHISLPGTEYSQLAFSPDTRLLAGGGEHGDQVHVAVWEVEGGGLLHRWDWPKAQHPHSAVESLEFAPDGRRLAAAVFWQSAAYLWDMTTGRQVARLGHDEVSGLSFTPDSQSLVTAGWDEIIRFWESDGGALRRTVNLHDRFNRNDLRMHAVCCAPEGGLIATAHLDGRVTVWKADEMRPLQRFYSGDFFGFGALRFSPNGLWLATGTARGEVRLWDPYSGRLEYEPGRHQDVIYTLSFGGGGRTLATGGNDGVCYFWDLRPAGRPRVKSPEALWHDLFDDDPRVAYRAMWLLSETPDRAVATVAERLRAVTLVIDLAHIAERKNEVDVGRLRRIRTLMAKRDTKVVSALGLRYVVMLLEQVGTPDAIGVLKTLADGDLNADVRHAASAALVRLGPAGKR